jgi:hypothetical protein
VEGVRFLDYRGERYALGRTDDAYAIWSLGGGPPERTFPLTDAGWAAAWTTYRALEAAVAVTAVQPGAPPDEGGVALVPRTAGKIIGAAFRLYGRAFWTLVAVTGVVQVVFHGLSIALIVATARYVTVTGPQGPIEVPQTPPWVGGITSGLLYGTVTPFLTAAVLLFVSNVLIGDRPALVATYRRAFPKIWSVLWVSILTFVVAALPLAPGIVAAAVTGNRWSVLLILLGVPVTVFIGIRFAFSAPTVVLEGIKGRRAMARSWRLVTGFGWRVLGTTLLAALIQFGVLFVVGFVAGVIAYVAFLGDSFGRLPIGFLVTVEVVQAVVTTFTLPIVTLVLALLYLDARVRKEGLDVDRLAEERERVRAAE